MTVEMIDLAEELTAKTLDNGTLCLKKLAEWRDKGIPMKEYEHVPQEVMYFALALTSSAVFLFYQGAPEALSDNVISTVLKGMYSSKTAFQKAVEEYRARHIEYAKLLPALFDEQTKGDPFVLGSIARLVTGTDNPITGAFLLTMIVPMLSELKDILAARRSGNAKGRSESWLRMIFRKLARR
jgi:hypothetical protein